MYCFDCGGPYLETLEEVVTGQTLECPYCDTAVVFTWLETAQTSFRLVRVAPQEDR